MGGSVVALSFVHAFRAPCRFSRWLQRRPFRVEGGRPLRLHSQQAAATMPKGDGYGGEGRVIEPGRGIKATSVLIWLHGLGDTAEGWAPVMPELRLPSTRFILPTAETRSVTLNFGIEMPAWSDIFSLDERVREDEQGILESVARVSRIVEGEITQKGLAPERVFLGGFSQGGAIALQAYLRSEHPLGGFLGLSTWLAMRNKVFAAIPGSRRSGRIALWHGDRDSIVNHAVGMRSAEQLRQSLPATFEVSFHTVKGLDHAMDREELNEFRRTLQDWVQG
ncbi:hypothetical protein CDCA_CDCA06G1993 [Cyanidium caldarium]|uniref:Phospholipase/carboxylesterase/thioesterase domain-containing protein n=1 Tax=Cyanidium caldarium TaxID=2771 RepID=A0AAV9IVY9_CYACA|nr:hypothetical protein CDCA_CDCA06G1993 [Cyanidium caldarium]